jgi:protein TonB
LKLFLFLILTIFSAKLFAQKNIFVKDSVYETVDEMPEFIGGEEKLFSFLQKNVLNNINGKEEELTGKVTFDFIVNIDGSLSCIKIKGLTNKQNVFKLTEQMKSMPKWKPGKQKGKLVRVKYHLPIYICLEE